MRIDTKAIAERVGASQTAVYYILKGQRNIGKQMAIRLSFATKRTAWWWLTATPEQIEREFVKLSKEGVNGRASTAAAN